MTDRSNLPPPPAAFGQLPDEWKVVPFPEVVFFQEGPGIRNWQYRSRGVPFVNIRCLVNGRLDRVSMNCLDPREVEATYQHFLLDADDYVVSSSGTIGRIAEVRDEDLPCMLNTSVIRMRPCNPRLDRRFLKWFLLSRLYQEQILAWAAGSVQVNYGPTHLKQMRICLPPLQEQRAIAEVLGSLDDKIELNRRMNRTLEQIAAAIFKAWFVDFEPVKAKAAGAKSFPSMPQPVFDALPASFTDSPLGPIPKGWRRVPLPELIEVNPTRSLRKGEAAPYLDMANMPMRGHAPDTWINRPFGSGMRFNNGDTLVARITPCLENGKTAFVDFLNNGQIGWGSTEYIVLRPKPPLPPLFAYCLARSEDFRAFAIQRMTGSSGRQRVPADCLSQFLMPEPSSILAAAFGGFVEPLFKQATLNMAQTRTLAAIRDALLPRLLSGEIRVADGNGGP